MIFFRPTKEWIDWLIDYAGDRIIVDIGCGEGLLLKELYRSGFHNIVGVDRFIRDEMRTYFIERGIHLWEFDTVENKFMSKLGNQCLFLFCRPCHGGFVEMTIPNLPAEAEVLYVGLPCNLDDDFPPYTPYRPVLLKAPALSEEKTYQIQKREHIS